MARPAKNTPNFSEAIEIRVNNKTYRIPLTDMKTLEITFNPGKQKAQKTKPIKMKKAGRKAVTAAVAPTKSEPKKKASSGAGALVLDLRKKLNMSQTELAKKLNVSQPSVSNIESGKQEISKEMAVVLERLFRISHKKFMAS